MAEKIMVRKLKLRQKSFCLAVEAPGTMEICEAKLVYRNVICPAQYPLKLEVKCREEKRSLLYLQTFPPWSLPRETGMCICIRKTDSRFR